VGGIGGGLFAGGASEFFDRARDTMTSPESQKSDQGDGCLCVWGSGLSYGGGSLYFVKAISRRFPVRGQKENS